MSPEEKVSWMKERNKDICGDITEMHQQLIGYRKRIKSLEAFYTLKVKEQKELVKQIYIMSEKITILPPHKDKKQNKTVFESRFAKSSKNDQEKTLAKLLAIRDERQRKKLVPTRD